MVVRAGSFLATGYFALESFVICRMIMLLFPAMAKITIGPLLASSSIIINIIFGFPIEARLSNQKNTMGW